MSETFELADEPEEPKASREPVQPLRRLWREEPDEAEELESAKKSLKDGAIEPSRKSSKSKPAASAVRTKPSKGKGSPAADEQAGKKVLIEETPTLDTYESRRRIRLIVGGLSVACLFLLVLIVHGTFFSDPLPIESASTGDATATQKGSGVRLLPDQEARVMFNRARDFARDGRTDQAVAMLNKIVKVYKGTPTARESKAALDRAGTNLPLFSDRPVVVAQPEEPKPAPTPPPAVVTATPAQPRAGQAEAALVLPVNPAEAVVVPPTTSPTRSETTQAGIALRSLPPGFQPSPDAGIHNSGWPLVIVGDRDGAPMVLVPAGTFTMGSSEGEPSEAPEHPVRLPTYYIDQHEVTNHQFRIFLGESHYHGKPAGKWLTDEKARAESDLSPIIHVNFQDAEAFAAWAGKQIPTEAQWEMAARSTDGRRYPWGDESVKWSRPRAFHQVDPVMTFAEDRSPYGAFDMAGNVHEWTRDVFEYRYYHHFTKTTADNPTGPTPSTRGRIPQHAVRGGAKNWSVTYREGVPADRRLSYLGFRCALVVEAQSPAPPGANPAALPPGAPPTARQKNSPLPF